MFKIVATKAAKTQLEQIEALLAESIEMGNTAEAREIKATLVKINSDIKSRATKLWIKSGSVVGMTVKISKAVAI